MSFQARRTKILYRLPNIDNFEFGEKFCLNQDWGEGFSEGIELKNKQGQALENVYKSFVEDGQLTKEEFKKLEGIDDILDAADIIINKQTGDATIVTNGGECKTIDFKGSGGHCR